MTVEFLDGAACLASATIALYFLRFWRETGDRLFAFFAIAFAVFAINRVALTVIDDASEARTVVYVIRALAFSMLIVAILEKNRPGNRN